MADLNKLRDLADQMQAELGPRDTTQPPQTPGQGSQPPEMSTVGVTAGQSIQSAINKVPVGGTVMIGPGQYQEEIRITKRVNLRYTGVRPAGRRTRNWGPVTIISPGPGITISPGSVGSVLSGIAIESLDPDATLILDQGKDTVLDGILGLGDPKLGQHHGIMAHGQGGRYLEVYVDDCGRVGQDAQALIGFDGTRDLRVEGSYFGGAGQSVMFGGGDSTSPEAMPRDIVIRGCELGKNPAWYGLGWQMKCALELKAVDGFVGEDLICSYAGVGEGQAAYSILITPRNQNGKANWTVVRNVRLERVKCTIAGGGVSILAQDNNHPTGVTENVVLRDVAFLELDPLGIVSTPKYKGSGRVINIDGACKNLTFERVTAQGINLRAGLYVKGATTGLVVSDLKLPGGVGYPFKVDNGGVGPKAVQALMPDAVVRVTGTDLGAQNLP